MLPPACTDEDWAQVDDGGGATNFGAGPGGESQGQYNKGISVDGEEKVELTEGHLYALKHSEQTLSQRELGGLLLVLEKSPPSSPPTPKFLGAKAHGVGMGSAADSHTRWLF